MNPTSSSRGAASHRMTEALAAREFWLLPQANDFRGAHAPLRADLEHLDLIALSHALESVVEQVMPDVALSENQCLFQAVDFDLEFSEATHIRVVIALGRCERGGVRFDHGDDVIDSPLELTERCARHQSASGDGAPSSGLTCH